MTTHHNSQNSPAGEPHCGLCHWEWELGMTSHPCPDTSFESLCRQQSLSSTSIKDHPSSASARSPSNDSLLLSDPRLPFLFLACLQHPDLVQFTASHAQNNTHVCSLKSPGPTVQGSTHGTSGTCQGCALVGGTEREQEG